MDLSNLGALAGSLARAGLPTLGTILSDAAPFPFNLFVRPAFAAITAALGVSQDAPDAAAQVQAKIEADPADAVAKLQAVEQAHKDAADAANEELRLRLTDVQDARSTEVKLTGSKSIAAYGVIIVSAIAIIGFLAIAAYLVIAGDHEMRLALLTAMIGGWTSVIGYWLGSSAGSAAKDDHLAELAKAPTVQAQPGANVHTGSISGKR